MSVYKTVGIQKREVIALLAEYGPMTTTAVARLLGYEPATAQGLMQILRHEGKVAFTGRRVGHAKVWGVRSAAITGSAIL